MTGGKPDVRARLQQAAMELFAERGYADVTIDEIAKRAGMTKRSFFNHFPDKREVLFAGATEFEQNVARHLAEVVDELEPVDAALHALARAGLDLAGYADFARARHELIASSTELRERDLIKMAALAESITPALCRRGIAPRTASITAQTAVAVFTHAYADWIEEGTAAELLDLMQQSMADLRKVVG